MAISVGGTDEYDNTGSASVQLTCPTGTIDGDTLLVVTADIFGGTTSVTPPSGWDAIGSTPYSKTVSGATVTGGLWRRISEGDTAGTTSWTWTLAGSHKAIGILNCFHGAWEDFDANGTDVAFNTVGSATSQNLPALTPHSNQAMLYGFIIARNSSSGLTNNATTVPTGWTKSVDAQTTQASGANNAICTTMYKQLTTPTSAATGLTLVNASFGVVGQVALFPKELKDPPSDYRLASMVRGSMF